MLQLNFRPVELPASALSLRQEVRAFLRTELGLSVRCQLPRSWTTPDPEFSRKVASQGWIGMIWPRKYGGWERNALERHVVMEELLAAGAPVGAHWISDRQSGPQLLRFGTEAQKQRFLPPITRGELYFCIGMSEPSAGSDLAAIRTRAIQVEGGWLVNGSKIWTTNADISHFMIALVRTAEPSTSRHQGLSQFIIDLGSPGISIRPIKDLMGVRQFSEVFFNSVFVSQDMLLGSSGDGWNQVTTELWLERSGPERYLSSYQLLEVYGWFAAQYPDTIAYQTIGNLTAQLWTLRQMSIAIADHAAQGLDPSVEAAVLKDLGTTFEQQIPAHIQSVLPSEMHSDRQKAIQEMVNYFLQSSPAFSIRGGTREILRGIIARRLALR